MDSRTMKKAVTLMIRFPGFEAYQDSVGCHDFKWVWNYEEGGMFRSRFDSFEDAVGNAWRVFMEDEDFNYLF